MDKKIAVDIRMLNHSGIGTYIRSILPKLISTLPDSLFFLIAHKNLKEELYKLFAYKNVNIIWVNSEIYTIREQFEIPFKIKKIDLYWTPHYNVPVFLSSKIKKVVTIHDVYHLAYFNEQSLIKKIYLKIIMKRAVQSKAIITVSNFSKKEIMKYTQCNSDRINVIYNGVNAINNNVALEELPSNNNLEALKNKRCILFVGNVKPHKNLKVIVDAFQLFLDKDEFNDVVLLIVGKKDGFITGDSQVINMIKNNELLSSRIHFTGWIEEKELSYLYQNASFLIFPSLYEGFGLPPLEAMLANCPVIVSNAACLPEVCGEAALYFNPNSCEELKKQIVQLFENEKLRHDLVDKGKERIKAFSWEKSISLHKKLLSSL